MGPEGPDTTSESERTNRRYRDEAWHKKVFEPGCDGWAAVIGVTERGCGHITAQGEAHIKSR